MLHLMVLGAVLTAPPAELRDAVTVEQQKALQARVAPLVLQLRRSVPLRPGRRAPGERPAIEGNVWHVAKARVVTASALCVGWPRNPKDRIEVRDPSGVWRSAAVGLIDVRMGLAVLDVPGLSAPPALQKVPSDKAMYAGRPLYSVALSGGLLQRHLIDSRPREPRAYYWWVRGDAPVGTPLFDSEGGIVSIIGLASPTQSARALALPVASFKELFERSVEWMPSAPSLP